MSFLPITNLHLAERCLTGREALEDVLLGPAGKVGRQFLVAVLLDVDGDEPLVLGGGGRGKKADREAGVRMAGDASWGKSREKWSSSGVPDE